MRKIICSAAEYNKYVWKVNQPTGGWEKLKIAIWQEEESEDSGLAFQLEGILYCIFSGTNLNLKKALAFFEKVLG